MVKSTSIYDKSPQSQTYFNILKDIGLKVFDEHLEINLTESDILKAGEFLIKDIPQPRILVACLQAGSPGKEWSIKNWISVIKYLKDNINLFLSDRT